MAYNPPNLTLDFDDDMFLGNAVSSLSNPSDLQNNLYTSEPLEIEDSKMELLDVLVTNNANNNSKS